MPDEMVNEARENELDDFEAFIPTDMEIARAKLDLAGISPNDTVVDLGCGDGRVLVLAAHHFNARGIGVDIRDDVVEQARRLVGEQGLSDWIEITQGDFMDANIADADVVVLYLNRGTLGKLAPKLSCELRTGAIIVTHDFDLPGWNAARELDLVCHDGQTVKLYQYVKDC